jgi:molecular chaperone DnaK
MYEGQAAPPGGMGGAGGPGGAAGPGGAGPGADADDEEYVDADFEDVDDDEE